MILRPDDYDIRHYSSRVLHAHYIHVIVYIHDLITPDLIFCYSRWYLTCQFILPSDLLFIFSSALLILSFAFTYPYNCFFSSCVHLLVCFWRTLIFYRQSLRRPTSRCSKEPKKITRRESDVSYLMYFDILSCYDVPMLKLYLLLFLYYYVSNLVFRQRLL